MATLYITRAQPNPPGKDTSRRGSATNAALNEEWVEFEARGGAVSIAGVSLTNLTFGTGCRVSEERVVTSFSSGVLQPGESVRVHTGRGTAWREGNVWHLYANDDWFRWNNLCGDRATLWFNQQMVDWASYDPNPPEGVLQRQPGTNRLTPALHGLLR